MQEELAHVLADGTYRLTPQSQPSKCLDTYEAGNLGGIQIYQAGGNGQNQKCNLTWLGDGTYRLTPQSATKRALDTVNENTSQTSVQAHDWRGGDNRKWILSPLGNNKFRVGPRNCWWLAMTVEGTSNVVIGDGINSANQQWTFTKLLYQLFHSPVVLFVLFLERDEEFEQHL